MTKKQKIKHENWVSSYRQNSKNHFIKRFNERLKFSITDSEYTELNNFFRKQIQPKSFLIKVLDKKTTIMITEGRARKWFKIEVGDPILGFNKIWVLWDVTIKSLVTILDEEPNDIDASIYFRSDFEKQWDN